MKQLSKKRSNDQQGRKTVRRRAGSVTVEMAVILPIAFAFFFAAVETTRINMIINGAENTAYEGARVGILPGANKARIKSAAREILDAVLVKGGKIKINPDPLTDDATSITVTVTIPLNKNFWGENNLGQGKKVKRSCTLTRETSFARAS
jgi:Flp pilus assembly protein TadG